jgi:hypothetical protein
MASFAVKLNLKNPFYFGQESMDRPNYMVSVHTAQQMENAEKATRGIRTRDSNVRAVRDRNCGQLHNQCHKAIFTA